MTIPSPPKVLHVALDERGGGRAHLRVLRAALGDAVRWDEVLLDPRRLGARPGGWLEARRRIGEPLGAGPALVHAHGARAAAAVLAGGRRGVPVVVTVHGLHSIRRSGGPAALAATVLNRAVLGRADRVMVLSEDDRRLIAERRLAPPERLRRIHPAFEAPVHVDRSEARRVLGLPERVPVILWLGRLAAEKDPLTFLAAVEGLRRKDAVVLVVGDGPLLPEFQARLAHSDASRRVRVLGWMEDPAVPVAAADLFVNTSRWEAAPPMAALEAASAGLALILTDGPGNGDVAGTGIPAVLVPAGHPAALARQMEVLLDDQAALRRRGRATRAAVTRSATPERLRREVLAAYGELLEGSASRAPAAPARFLTPCTMCRSPERGPPGPRSVP